MASREVNVIGNTVIVRGANLACQDLRVLADSAFLYEQSRQYQLFGRVRIDNADIRLTSRTAQYNAAQEQISAQGNIDLLRKQDSTRITNGENLMLVRGAGGEDVLNVSGGRPHAVLRPSRSDDAPADSAAQAPYEVDADRIVVTGQDQFQANGTVEIRRGDLDATADEVQYFGASGQLILRGNSQLNTEKYDLDGDTILVTMAGDEISEVIARGGAALSGDIDITGGVIQLELVGGELDRVTVDAVTENGASRGQVSGVPTTGRGGGPPSPGAQTPGATGRAATIPPPAMLDSEDFTMTGRRLVIEVNGAAIERVEASGGARLVSLAGDSLNAEDTPEVVRRDWMEGDRIIALFSQLPGPDSLAVPTGDSVAVPAAPRDTVTIVPGESASLSDSADAPEQRLEQLDVIGNARALYRLPPADTTEAADSTCAKPGRFAVHYVLGDTITISMKDGGVAGMEVTGQVAGEHLEPPACRAAAPAADTTAPAAPPGAGTPPPEPPPGGTRPPPPGPGRQPDRDRGNVQAPPRQPEPTSTPR